MWYWCPSIVHIFLVSCMMDFLELDCIHPTVINTIIKTIIISSIIFVSVPWIIQCLIHAVPFLEFNLTNVEALSLDMLVLTLTSTSILHKCFAGSIDIPKILPLELCPKCWNLSSIEIPKKRQSCFLWLHLVDMIFTWCSYASTFHSICTSPWTISWRFCLFLCSSLSMIHMYLSLIFCMNRPAYVYQDCLNSSYA